MNRYFIPDEGRRDYPRRSYGRIDYIEPINIERSEDVTIAFDAVDADWQGLRGKNLLSLDQPEGSETSNLNVLDVTI